MSEMDSPPVQVTDWAPGDDLQPVTPVVLVVDVLGESPFVRSEVVDDPRVPGLDAIRAGMAELVAAFRAADVPVVFVEQNPRTGDLPAGLEARPEEYVIRRHRFSSFYGTELDLVLRGFGARTVVLAGGASDVQVHYTAVDAHQNDYHIRVATDLITGTGLELHEAALRALKYLQRDALVTSGAVRDWLGTLAPTTATTELDMAKENA